MADKREIREIKLPRATWLVGARTSTGTKSVFVRETHHRKANH